jgi:hypothetical protein
MKTENRIFITYLFPGSFFPEEITIRVLSASIPKTIPKDCFGFRFTETEFVIDGEKEFIGKSKPLGKTYIIGEAIPLVKIPDEIDGRDTRILKGNIEFNSPTKTAIRTHLGNWQQEDECHEAIPVSQFKLGKAMYYTNK